MKPRRQPMKRTELRSTTPLKRTGFQRTPRTSGPVKPRRSTPKSAAAKACQEVIGERSGGLCEISVPGICLGLGMVPSHRLRRSQSNNAVKWSPVNCLHGCIRCEDYLTDNGGNAKTQSFGWTVSAKAVSAIAHTVEALADPAIDPAVFALCHIPVFRRGQWVWLTPAGSAEPADLSEIATWLEAA